jgi:uncharacterized protein YndB with AHSA1/START domain
MFKIIVIALVLAVGGLLLFASTRPDEFRVQRSAVVKAPPEKIYPLIVDLKGWQAWSPWEKKDPAMKRTYSGPAQGLGAAYAWEGNKDVGAGRMEITEATPSSKVVFKLEFLKPFEATNTATFTLQPAGEGTTVTWVMDGKANILSKVMGILFDMDKMIGKDFEAGLESIRAVAEKPAA